MLAAYLRGYLDPEHHKYGLRSALRESLLIEVMASQFEKEDFGLSMQREASLVVNYELEAKRAALRRIGAHSARCHELSMMDLYRFGAVRGAAVDGIPLTKLFQIMRRGGMMKAPTEEEWEKILSEGKPLF